MKKIISLSACALLLVSCFAMTVLAVDTSGTMSGTGTNGVTIQSIDFSGADVTVLPQGGSTLNSLIDKNKASNVTAFGSEGVVLFMNKKATSAGVYTEFSLTMKLAEETSIGGAVISFYKEYNSMIGLPKDNKVKVEYSNDGTAFFPVGDYTFTGEAVAGTNEVQDASLTFNGVVNATFIRLTFAYGDSPFTTDNKVIWEFVGMTEIELTEGTQTSNPTTSETSQNPTTGDYSIWVSVVAATIAAAGIAVAVLRKER